MGLCEAMNFGKVLSLEEITVKMEGIVEDNIDRFGV